MIKNKTILYLIISMSYLQPSLPCFAMIADEEEDNRAVTSIQNRINNYRDNIIELQAQNNMLTTNITNSNNTLIEADNLISHLLNRMQLHALNPTNSDIKNILITHDMIIEPGTEKGTFKTRGNLNKYINTALNNHRLRTQNKVEAMPTTIPIVQPKIQKIQPVEPILPIVNTNTQRQQTTPILQQVTTKQIRRSAKPAPKTSETTNPQTLLMQADYLRFCQEQEYMDPFDHSPLNLKKEDEQERRKIQGNNFKGDDQNPSPNDDE